MHLQIFPAQHAFLYLLCLFYLCLLIFFFFFQKFGVPNWNQRTGPCVMVSWTAPGPGSPDNSRVQPFYWIIVLVALFFLQESCISYKVVFLQIHREFNQLKLMQKKDHSNEMQLTFEGLLKEFRVGSEALNSESHSLHCL